ncbi:MAG TPA: hypothetical protein VHC22_03850 [Pirellulales bacterium]|nr:hypothetical protein [Pirellulales bacterium]
MSNHGLLALAGKDRLVMSGNALHGSPAFAAVADRPREAVSTHYMAVGDAAENRQRRSGDGPGHRPFGPVPKRITSNARRTV